jgi:sulfur dioxygenase
MLLKQLFDSDTWTYTYLLADQDTREAIIIDPVLERVERDLALIAELGLELLYTLDTHVHADHVTGSGELRRRTGATSGVSAIAEVACVDRPLNHGDRISFGRYTLEVRSTPGHTDGCLTYVVDADGQMMAFTGDALLIRGCGRTDFQQGSAEVLYRSVRTQLYTLPSDTIIYPGHDYRGHTASTVAEEKAHNPRLKVEIAEVEFIQLMADLDLAYPKRIHDALPANLACGVVSKGREEAPAPCAIKELSPGQFSTFSGGRVVDVRSSEEFQGELGHLPEALLTPLAELRYKAVTWLRDVPLLVVCRSGRRSIHGCSMLVEMGFTNVTNLSGGLQAWRAHQGVTS